MKKHQLLGYGTIIGSTILAWCGPDDWIAIGALLAVVVMTVLLIKEITE